MRLYIQYVEFLKKCYNAVDESFYDAINLNTSKRIQKGLFIAKVGKKRCEGNLKMLLDFA